MVEAELVGIVCSAYIATEIDCVEDGLVPGADNDRVFELFSPKEHRTRQNFIAVEFVTVCANNQFLVQCLPELIEVIELLSPSYEQGWRHF